MLLPESPQFHEAIDLDTRQLPGEPGSETCFVGLVFSQNGTLLCDTDLDAGVAHLWDTESGEMLHRWSGGFGAGAAFSPCGHLLALASSSEVAFHVLKTGNKVISWFLEESKVGACYQLRFTIDGNHLVVTDASHLYCIDVNARLRTHQSILSPGETVLQVKQLLSGKVAVLTLNSVGQPSHPRYHLRIRDPQRAEVREVEVSGQPYPLLSPDGRILVMQRNDELNGVELFNLDTLRVDHRLPIEPDWGPDFHFARDGSLLIQRYRHAWNADSGVAAGLAVWDVTSGALFRRLAPEIFPPSFACSSKYDLVGMVVNARHRTVDRTTFWNFRRGILCGKCSGHPNDTSNLTFSPCGRWFASAATHNSAMTQSAIVSPGTSFLTDLTRLSIQDLSQ